MKLRDLVACALVFATSACSTMETRGVESHLITEVAESASPRILCIVAHPDDEISFAGTLYKASTALGAACDVLTITNGEAGYKYSTLAERLYGLELTDPEIGRKYLPEIRLRELKTGLSYLAVHKLYVLKERDDGYSKDRFHVLDPKTTPWDLTRVRSVLDRILADGHYDIVLTHLPSIDTHGHHQSATLLAIEAVSKMSVEKRPAILGARGYTKSEPPKEAYAGLDGETSTLPKPNAAPLEFDRTEPFSFQGKLNYKVVVNWAIAAHKSQGTMQLGMNRGDVEQYWPYAATTDAAYSRAAAFFANLKKPQFVAKDYPDAVVK